MNDEQVNLKNSLIAYIKEMPNVDRDIFLKACFVLKNKKYEDTGLTKQQVSNLIAASKDPNKTIVIDNAERVSQFLGISFLKTWSDILKRAA